MAKKGKGKKRRKSRVTKAALIIIAVCLILLIAMPVYIMSMFLGQRYDQEQFTPESFGIQAERVTLTTDDSIKLAAWHARAGGQARGTVVMVSGIQNPSVTAFLGYAKMLAGNGWDTLLVEMRARSQSEGEEIGFAMTEWMDVKAGVEYIAATDDAGELPIIAMGTSMGAGAAIIAAGEVPRIDGVISISAFSSWTDVLVENMAMMGIPKAIGWLDVPFMNLCLGIHFGFGALGYSPYNGMEKLGARPILLMHSTGDTQVPYANFERLLKNAQQHNIDVTTFIRNGDEHFVCYEQYFQNPSTDKEFSEALLTFLHKFE